MPSIKVIGVTEDRDRSVNEVSTDHQEDASQLNEDTGKTKKSGKSKGGNAGRMFGRGAYEDIP